MQENNGIKPHITVAIWKCGTERLKFHLNLPDKNPMISSTASGSRGVWQHRSQIIHSRKYRRQSCDCMLLNHRSCTQTKELYIQREEFRRTVSLVGRNALQELVELEESVVLRGQEGQQSLVKKIIIIQYDNQECLREVP